jgi:hypothetical protein
LAAKSLGLVFLAQIMANPILLAVSLIAGAVLFIVSYVTLMILGLVTAVLFAMVGLGLVWLIGRVSSETLRTHWYIMLIVPAAFLIGLVADRVPMGLSMIPIINQNYILAPNAVTGGESASLFGPYVVATLALMMAVLALLLQVSGKKNYMRKLKKMF